MPMHFSGWILLQVGLPPRPASLTYDTSNKDIKISLLPYRTLEETGKDVAKFQEELVCKGKRKILELVELCYVHKETLRALIT